MNTNNRKLSFMKLKLFFAALLSIAILSNANAQRTCGTPDYLNHLRETDEDAYNHIMEVKQQNLEAAAHMNGSYRAVVTIPVVIHVMHNGEAVGTGKNISDAQIQSQMDVLNQDFRKLNADVTNVPSVWTSLVADCEIEFCLASLDENGSPTTGIERINMGSSATWSDSRKPSTIWDRNKYLNIWIADIGGGILGYTTPPGSPANQDGVVIGYQYFGTIGAAVSPFNKGRTATHEIGHWFGLEHIWGDDSGSCSGSDGVADTPNQADENYGCPSFPHTDACSSSSPGVMFMNYMDYVDDACMYMFTNGQKSLMTTVINGTRSSLKTSNGCGSTGPVITVNGQVIDAATSTAVANAKVRIVGAVDMEVSTNSSGNFTISGVPAGNYEIYAGKWGYSTTQYGSSVALSSSTAAITIPINNNHYYDDVVLNLGWTASSTASSGDWEIGNPVGTDNSGTPSNPGADVTIDYGSRAFITGNGGGTAGNDDIDGGEVDLYSPNMDLSNYNDPYIHYYRWFYNGGGSTAIDDAMEIYLLDGSAHLIYTITGVQNTWTHESFRVKDFTSSLSSLQFSVAVADVGNPHLVEAAIDLFYVTEGPTAVADVVATDEFAIYPNPASDYIQVIKKDEQAVEMNVVNQLGQKVITDKTYSGKKVVMDISQLNKGVYYLNYITNQQSYSVKFIKQ